MKTKPFLYVVSLVICASLSGCKTSDSQSTSSSTAGTSPPSTDAAILKISGNRNRSEDAAADIKQRFKSSRPEYVKAQQLYRDARAENNSWLDLLQNKIRNGSKPEKSSDFKEQSNKAGIATDKFLKYADSLAQSEGQASPVLAAMGAAEIVKMFVENGLTIWKTYSEQRQAARERNAKDLERLRWDSWTSTEKGKTEPQTEKTKGENPKAQ